MPEIINSAVSIPVSGGKRILELIGSAAGGDCAISIAHMSAPAGWTEPFQTPDFAEYTIVIAGTVTVECDGKLHSCGAGGLLVTAPGERVRYGVGPEGAEYYAVCLPAFSTAIVHREGE